MQTRDIGNVAGLAEELALLRHRVATLTVALESNRVIAMAVGLLMHREGLDREQAFARLVSESQHRNLKVGRVASDLLAAVESRYGHVDSGPIG